MASVVASSDARHSAPLHLSLVDDADEFAKLHQRLAVFGEDDARIPRQVVKRLNPTFPTRTAPVGAM